MEFFQAIILGIFIGLTEFLPVPSSAHLVLIPYFSGWEIPQQDFTVFKVLVHWGTFLALIVYFWKDLLKIILDFFSGIFKGQPFADSKSRFGWMILIVTVPAVVINLVLHDWVEMAFENPFLTGVFLLITAVLLLCAEYFGKQTRQLPDLNWKDAIWIGCFQIISIFPGISRFSSTIMGGLLRHFDRSETAHFCFLISAPIMLTIGIIQTIGLSGMLALVVIDALPIVIPGSLVAGVAGYFSIKWLISFSKKNALSWFALYCFVLGAITMFVNLYVYG